MGKSVRSKFSREYRLIQGPRKFLLLATLLSVALVGNLSAQQTADPPDPPPATARHAPDSENFILSHPNERDFFKHLASDQKDIWTSPSRLQPKDAEWLVPVGGITAGLFASDSSSAWGLVGPHAKSYNTASDAGLFAAAGLTGSAYLWGRFTQNEHLRETGVLAAEAMIDTLGVQYPLQYGAGRLTPEQSHFQNSFFQNGTSFPSNHAALTWAFASVVAREYPNPLAEIGAYGLATGVSLARAGAGKHYLSDVFIGGLIGYETGKHIYNKRHDTSLDDFVEMAPNPEHLASTYVPLDSWISTAMYRLITRGYIDGAFMGLRPWTRMNCARMIAGLDSEVEGTPDVPPDIAETLKDLRVEFANELSALEGRPVEGVQLSSVYTRLTGIAGQPLNDSNLGQTIVNDYGRPYREGINNYTGFTARADDGMFAFYVNGEYQYAPSAPAYPLATREVLATVNNEPVQPGVPFPTSDRFRLLDTYVTTRMLGHDISVGKQSLDWGPTQSGSFAISNNAEPIWMLRLNRSEPLWIPGVSRVFGFFRTDNFFGSLSGHTQFPRSPYMYGQKISFKPLGNISIFGVRPFKNLEMGVSRTTVFAGQDHVPLTFGSFWNSFTSFTDVSPEKKNSRKDPGARFSSFDFSWQVGGWSTLYVDMLTHDEILPLVSFRRSAFNPGIYISHFPGLSKLDFRVEGLTTNRETYSAKTAYFFYYEALYRNLYVNNGTLMGNWIGRDADGFALWSTYTISPFSNIQLGYRGMKIASNYIPQGTTQNVGSIATTFRVRKQLEVKGLVQYEKWLVPVLNPNRQTDVAVSMQLTWFPKNIGLKH